MERGLIWLPLLALFFWLVWAGRKEFQKVQGYQAWSKRFQRAKYDLYAVVGQNGAEITWGKPTPQGIENLQTLSLTEVTSIQLMVDGEVADVANPPERGKECAIAFELADTSIRIPFTEISLAAAWTQKLTEEWQALRQPSPDPP